MTDIEDLVPGTGDVVRDGTSPVAVYKDESGELHKMTAICPCVLFLFVPHGLNWDWDCAGTGTGQDVARAKADRDSRHLKGIVAWNNDEKSFDCPIHGSRFTCKGEVVNGPARGNLVSQKDKAEPSTI